MKNHIWDLIKNSFLNIFKTKKVQNIIFKNKGDIVLSYSDDLMFYKSEKNRIQSEINDLETRIIVAGGRGNRGEVNDYRRRINSLKIKLNEIYHKINVLEKNQGQIQVVGMGNDVGIIKAGGTSICDDMGQYKDLIENGFEIVETTSTTVERKVNYKNGNVISKTETVVQTINRRILKKDDSDYIETALVE